MRNGFENLVVMMAQRVGNDETGYYGAVKVDQELIECLKTAHDDLRAFQADTHRLQLLVDNKIAYANQMRLALNKARRMRDAEWEAFIAGCLV